ncbi:alpha/beta-hydrolase [Aulographum hederae CBS 113979]|uniref:Alpha/beta-hydrolase n=1 Tax=Aulographum hederae CBS 113979 TaxID=1176131 RepID=A0A6G1HFC8_9PEZI|nr:alpha/beta-hydrolase [Aulographum hederae CBS 113979]
MALACDDCVNGTIHKGEPAGTEELLHGLNTYIIGNRTTPKAIIVLYSDIFGLPLPNNKLIADAYAASNPSYLVYLPDFFDGDPAPLTLADTLLPVDAAKQSKLKLYTGILTAAPGFLMWMRRHKAGPSDKACQEFLGKLRRATLGDGLKVGIAGFCWGGKYALRAGLEGSMIEISGEKVPLVDAAVGLHPSHVAVPADVETLVVPTSFGWGVEDSGVKFEQKAEIEALQERVRKEGRKVPEMEHRVYTPGRHGFAVRGNPEDPAERKALEDSEKQVLEWFGRWLL